MPRRGRPVCSRQAISGSGGATTLLTLTRSAPLRSGCPPEVAHDRKQVKDSPSISTDGELPAADEEAIFKHYGLTYQAGTNGERQLARR
jgi:hypothetical protein